MNIKSKQILKLWVKLNRATQTLSKSNDLILKDNDLSTAQFGILDALLHKGDLCQKDLGEKILCSSGNITMVIDNLERYGYVRRIRSKEDRRYYQIQITEEGQKKINIVLPLIAGNLKQHFDIISTRDQITLSRFCKQLGLQKTK